MTRWMQVVGLALLLVLLLGGCASDLPGSMRSFSSNGERIYFSGAGTNGPIRAEGGQSGGMMGRGMMGQSMMGGGRLACADCHGNNARGGVHTMHMQVMDAPDIRWRSLAGESAGADEHEDSEDDHDMAHAPYTAETFARAVREGIDPAGESLDSAMPRWHISDEDVADLIEYLDTR